jgi:DNA-binding NarL/FixJ family response regulator
MSVPENQSIVIADPQFLTGFALQQVLGQRYSVAGRVNTKSELFSCLEQKSVSVLIIDFALFDFEGISELSFIKEKYSSLNILVFTNTLGKNELNDLTNIGIKNIVLKTAGEEELLEAVEAGFKGKKYYSQEILDILIENNIKKEKVTEPHSLTSSEIEIVRLIAQGFTTKEIALHKFISFHTVMTHRKNIFRKLNVSSVSELIMHAIKAGWIDNIEYYI